MKKSKTSVSDIISDMKPWEEGLLLLREIILEAGLKEEIKWGGPVYTLDGRNVVGILGFKQFFSIWFYQGVFLRDPAGVLINAEEGRTRAQRQWRFTAVAEINPVLVSKYIREAVKNAKEGKEIKPERKAALPIPAELDVVFAKDPVLKTAFDRLSPGKRREYLEHIAGAKAEATRHRRVKKAIPIILAGQGLHDKYK